MKYKLFLLAVLMPLCAMAQTSEKKIVAYVTSWSSITPDPKVMTHINYDFGGVGSDGQGSQISLQEIKDGIASGKWTDHWDDTAKVPYVTDKNDNFAYGYDDDRSLTIKCQHIISKKLAGAMYLEYDNKGTERTTVYNGIMGTER